MSTTTQAQSAAQTLAAFVAANMFTLAGGGLHVSYSTSGIDGKPHMTYQDRHALAQLSRATKSARWRAISAPWSA